MSDNKKIILDFINNNLEWSDNTIVAKKLGVDRNQVSRVRHGHSTSKRILNALLDLATEHKKHALKIAEYNSKPVNI